VHLQIALYKKHQGRNLLIIIDQHHLVKNFPGV
jgi:hypothetical protein